MSSKPIMKKSTKKLKVKISKDTKKEKRFNWGDDTWAVIDSYYMNPHNLVRHQIESYNYFMTTGIRSIIRDNSPLVIPVELDKELGTIKKEFHIDFDNVYISKPIINENTGKIKLMYPHDARLRDLTYNSAISIDIKHKFVTYKPEKGQIHEEGHNLIKKVFIGKIPIMLHSNFCTLNELTNKTTSELGECEYDNGGYFIVKGSEKVLVSQEKKCENKVYIFPQNKQASKYSHIAEITSVAEDNMSVSKNFQVKLITKETGFGKTIQTSFVRLRRGFDIPLFVLFRALGVISDKQIVEYIVSDTKNKANKRFIDLLKPSISAIGSL